MDRVKKFYCSHPLSLASKIDEKMFRGFFAKNLFPKKCICSFCGKQFHNFQLHGNASEAAQNYNATMGPRFSDCPYCHSVDKYRWLWYVIENYSTLLQTQGKLLHFAPEEPIKERLQQNFHGDYVGGDLEPGRADYVVDMTNICFKEKSFDWIIACNVMEHIIEEKKAVQELHRVLKPDGVIILSFPVAFDLERTFEDRSLVSEEERIKNFGQEDHVRLYGKDYIEHFVSYGFYVTAYLPKDIMTEREIKINGFQKVTPILFLRQK